MLAHLAAGDISERTALALVPMYTIPEELQPYAPAPDHYWSGSETIVKEALGGKSSEQIRAKVKDSVAAASGNEEREENEKAKRLQAEQDHARRLAEAEEAGEPVEELYPAFDYQKHRQLDQYTNIPEGCTETCACRGVVMNHGQERVACFDKKRFEVLSEEHTNRLRRAAQGRFVQVEEVSRSARSKAETHPLRC